MTQDCRTGTACGAGTYCDFGTGQCRPGCVNDTGCTTAGQVCDLGSRTCVCRSGTHACGSACYPDNDAAHCGSSCGVCTTSVANSTVACVSGACVFACTPGFNKCGNRCASDSDVTACGASCTACPGGVTGGTPACSVGHCGVECQAGSYYAEASGTCNPLTIAVAYNQSVTGPVGTWEGSFDQKWVVPKASGFEEFRLDKNGTVWPSGTSHTTAFTALPSLISAAETGTYSYPNYLAIVGTGVQYLHTWSTTSERCSWMDAMVQNPTRVVMGGTYISYGTDWAAVENAQGVTVAALSVATGSTNCQASSKQQVAAAGAKLWAVEGDVVITSVGNTLTAKTLNSSASPRSWTLPGAPDEVTRPFARVGSTVYVLPSSSGSPVKVAARNVAFIGPRPLGGVNGDTGPVCMRYSDGLRCGHYDSNTNILSPGSRVSTDSSDFHAVIRSWTPALFYRTSAGIKWTVLQ